MCVNQNYDLVNESIALKKKVVLLTNVSHKLTQGKENLDKLLVSQRLPLSKSGLGYDYKNDNKSYHTRFVRSHASFSFSKCKYCGKIGCISYSFNLKNNAYIGVKKMWVPKGTVLPNMIRTNHCGPKRQWVPKTRN